MKAAITPCYGNVTTGRHRRASKVRAVEWTGTGALGSMNFSTRLLNHRTLGWSTQDPCAEDFHWLSPYCICGDDPINYVDNDGCRFSENAIGLFNNLRDGCLSSFIKSQDTEYLKILMEIMILRESDQLYDIILSPNINNGSTLYNLESDAVTIYLPDNLSQEDLLILLSHEQQHCFQFETGDICLAIDGNTKSGAPVAYDLTDEKKSIFSWCSIRRRS